MTLFIGSGERKFIALGLTVVTVASGCVSAAIPASPVDQLKATSAAIQKNMNCLDLKPSINACANKVSYEQISPQVDSLRVNLSTADISQGTKQIMLNTIATVDTMQKEGKIRWYTYKQEGLIGTTIRGRSNFVIPGLIGQEFFVILILPQNEPGDKAKELAIYFHELFHAVKAYERFKQGADPVSDVTPQQEEYDSEYLGLLVEKVLRDKGFLYSNSSRDLKDMGVDLAEVVGYLDKNHIDANSKIYHYFSDMRMRFILWRGAEEDRRMLAVWSSDQEIQRHLDNLNAQIKQIDSRYKNYPLPGLADNKTIQAIKTHQSWFDPSFFPNQPQSRNFNPYRTNLFIHDRSRHRQALIRHQTVYSYRDKRAVYA